MTALETDATSVTNVTNVDLKLEVVVVPVSDVDRAKEFYAKLGWRLDADFHFDNGFRVVQLDLSQMRTEGQRAGAVHINPMWLS